MDASLNTQDQKEWMTGRYSLDESLILLCVIVLLSVKASQNNLAYRRKLVSIVGKWSLLPPTIGVNSRTVHAQMLHGCRLMHNSGVLLPHLTSSPRLFQEPVQTPWDLTRHRLILPNLPLLHQFFFFDVTTFRLYTSIATA